MRYQTNPQVKAFIRTVRQQCRKCNIRFVLGRGYKVNTDGERCQGYFMQPDHSLRSTTTGRGELRVAVGGRRHSEWLYTLAHEYAHFLQWRRDDPIFDESDYYIMEAATETEAMKICRQFRLPIPRRLLQRSRRQYLARLKRSV